VSLSWDSAGSGISYKVYYSNQNDPSGAKPLGNPTTTPSFNVNSMASDMNYYFWVASAKDGQESGKSSVVTVRTAAVPVNPVPDNFVRINGGTFQIGSAGGEVGGEVNERPVHSVTVKSFYMGKYEVTQKEWMEIMGSNPSKFKGDNLPVEGVSWYDAVDYCNRRSQREGLTSSYTIDKTRRDQNNQNSSDNVKWIVTWNKNANGYRLPTEAEWEYACRAGTTGPFSTGSNITTSQANYDGTRPYNNNAKGTYRNKTWNVGSGTANAWGLYDMHGNVAEWCWDWYGYYASGAQTDPAGPASGGYRVLRGGSYYIPANYLRSASRRNNLPSNGNGFRLVRNAE
jgi:formylglycine-generating enzyme required for sulfatase activity